MNARATRVAYWLIAIALLFVSGWFLNIAMYNWWAAGFPHNEYRHAYASRGNIFSVLAIVLFAAFVSVVVAILRASKKRRMAKT
ncbi:MAG: hypothetical protein WAN12_04610 [Candidatus Acidiferrum sp.]